MAESDDQSGPRPRLSVVLATWNGQHLLADCLPSLARALARTAPAETIVVDNASADGTVEWLAREWPGVRVLALAENRGYAGASNAGAGAARGDVVVFLNNDTEVNEAWAEELLAALADPAVVMAGGLTVFADRPDTVNSAGIRLLPTGGGTDEGFGAPAAGVSPEPRDVPGVSGVSMAVRRDWFLSAGGYDADFFMYFEDVDLCLRALLEGHRIRLVPGSLVHHRFGASAGAVYSPLRSFYASRNRVLVLVRNYDLPSLLLGLALSVGQDLGIVATMLAERQWRLAGSSFVHKFRGTGAGLALTATTWRERQVLAARRRRSVAELRRAGLVEGVLPAVRELRRIAATLR